MANRISAPEKDEGVLEIRQPVCFIALLQLAAAPACAGAVAVFALAAGSHPHQHVGVNPKAVLRASFAQRLQPSLPSPIILEKLLPVTATGHHLIHRARILDANRPGPGPGRRPHRNPAGQAQCVTFLGPTPSDPFVESPIIIVVYHLHDIRLTLSGVSGQFLGL